MGVHVWIEKQGPLVYCEATLEARLTFFAVKNFRYKNLHFVLSFFFLFISHNSLTKARKNYNNSPFCMMMCLLHLATTTSLAMAANTDKCSIHDTILDDISSCHCTALLQKVTIFHWYFLWWNAIKRHPRRVLKCKFILNLVVMPCLTHIHVGILLLYVNGTI